MSCLNLHKHAVQLAHQSCKIYLVASAHNCNEDSQHGQFVSHLLRETHPEVLALELCDERFPSSMRRNREANIARMFRQNTVQVALNVPLNPSPVIAPIDMPNSMIRNRMYSALSLPHMLSFRRDILVQQARLSELADAMAREHGNSLWKDFVALDNYTKSKSTDPDDVIANVTQGPAFFVPADAPPLERIAYREDSLKCATSAREFYGPHERMALAVDNVRLHDRNDYMVHCLRGVADSVSSVVALVGAAHVPGIVHTWQEAMIEQQPEALDRISAVIEQVAAYVPGSRLSYEWEMEQIEWIRRIGSLQLHPADTEARFRYFTTVPNLVELREYAASLS